MGVQQTSRREVGRRILALRSGQGLTQEQLAAAAGLSTRFIQKIEQGESDPKYSAMKAIAPALNLHLCDLIAVNPFVDGSTTDDFACAYSPLDEFPVGIQVCDANGLIKYVNAKCIELQGWSRSEVFNRFYIWDYMAHEHEKESLRDYLKILVKDRPKPIAYHAQNKTKSGAIVPLVVDWSYICDNSDSVIGFFSVLRDSRKIGV